MGFSKFQREMVESEVQNFDGSVNVLIAAAINEVQSNRFGPASQSLHVVSMIHHKIQNLARLQYELSEISDILQVKI